MNQNVNTKQKSITNEQAAHGTLEWASENQNFITGCTNNCKYCYSREMSIRFGRKTPENWKEEEIRECDLNKTFKEKKCSVMFPSSHDISPDNLGACLTFLGKLLPAYERVLIVSKPHLSCVTEICAKFPEYKDKILFRFSIGSSNSEILKFWEPGASSFEERLESLKLAYEKGFQTSVSCEPMLDDQVEKVIEAVLPFVTETIWIGKANRLRGRLKINGETNSQSLRRIQELLAWQSNANIKALYERFKDNPKLRWKDTIRKVIGLESQQS